MQELDKFNIDIFRLSNSTHDYQFEIGNSFFEAQPGSLISEGKGEVKVVLDKSDNFIQAGFELDLVVKLECDRSLEPFDYAIKKEESLIFKYGEEEMEIDDNIVIIHRNRQRINMAQYIYEFIGVSIPMKKLHPRFENEGEEDELIYSSGSESDEGGTEPVDPRWHKLKNLK